MLCDECKKRSATVHLTQIINDKKYEKNLCQQCASDYGQSEFAHESKDSIHNLLAGLLNFEPGVGAGLQKTAGTIPVCENCGMSYGEFGRGGRLGCPSCYTHFVQGLEPLLRRVQSGIRHNGKVPRRTGGTLALSNRIRQLRQELQQYIAKEEFEKAAQARDEIRNLERELEGKGVR